MEEEASSSEGGGQAGHRGGAMSSTHWTVVHAAGAGSATEHREAFGELYTAYLPPLLTYLRYKGYSDDSAMDLLQGFFAHLLQSSGLSTVRQSGRFRSWLLRSLNNFITDQWSKAQALKRGGGEIHLPIGPGIEEGEVDPQDRRFSPEQAYDRKWAITLLNRVLARLASEYAGAGRQEMFAVLKPFLSGQDDASGYDAIGAQLGMKANSVAVAVKRLRQRYADLLWAELGDTVDPGMVEEEWRHLQMAISS